MSTTDELRTHAESIGLEVPQAATLMMEAADTIEGLKRGSTKLRELVRELWFYAEQELVCDDNCPYGAACDWRDCIFRRRMRELGVEVNG